SLKGIVLDENQLPVYGANISYGENGTLTNQNGFYSLEIPADQNVQVIISYIGFENISFIANLPEGTEKELNFVLKTNVEQIGEVVITDRNEAVGVLTIEPEVIRKIP